MKIFFKIVLLLVYSFISNAQESFFLSQPFLSPNANKLVFCYEGDIWIADRNGSNAARLTAMSGIETNPKISPDGNWLAFTGRQFNNADIYIMPLNGGDIKQLTFHSSNDEMNSWAWDSNSIYFTSLRTGQISGYNIPIKGGTPKRILGEFIFQYDHLLMPHPTTGEIFFNDTSESSTQVHRKRYKGPFNPEIQSYNLSTKKHKKYTNWEGKDFAVTIDVKGNIYYLSDKQNGQYNLYEHLNNNKTALTTFNTSIKNAQVNANGGYIIFEKDYQLWLYDVSKKESRKIELNISRNFILNKLKDFDVKDKISGFDVSEDGKKIVFVSRGEIFVSDIEGKYINHIKRENSERVKEVKWLSDNKTIIYTQTNNGYTNLYTITADGKNKSTPITNENKNIRNLALNKSRNKTVFLSGSNEVVVLDLTKFTVLNKVKNEFWAFQNSSPSFSPNDEYILFTARRNFEEEIFVHQLKTNTTINITNTDVTETHPVWSPDGLYIYFASNRLKPSYPYGLQNAHIYRLALDKYIDPLKSDKYLSLFETEKKDSSKSSEQKSIEINFEKLMDRVDLVSPSFGTQNMGYIFQKDDKTSVLYTSNHDEGKNTIWKTTLTSFEKKSTEKISSNITDDVYNFDVVETKDKSYVLLNGIIHKLNLESNKLEPININITFRKSLEGEFKQMFEETWSQMNEGFYDEKMHGVNWLEIKKYYEKFIYKVNNRADLRILLNDMLGELNASHQGFNTSGAEEEIKITSQTIETGVIWDNNNPYEVNYIVSKSAADKKGINIKKGDKLIKVNNILVDSNINRDYYFTMPSLDNEIELTFERNGVNYTIKLHTQNSVSSNLYDEWISKNQSSVDNKSSKSIAYGHMKDMRMDEFEQFMLDMTQELNSKKALILDLRYNRGGNVHNDVLQFLSQKKYLNWKYRDGSLTQQPNFTPSDKPIVLLINEQSLSDAEMTAQGFKQMKLGTIIGNATYRWIIFTSGIGLVDGSSVRMPSWGCYTLSGENLEMTGVTPDIEIINSFEDKINGKDPQLDKAIEFLMNKLK